MPVTIRTLRTRRAIAPALAAALIAGGAAAVVATGAAGSLPTAPPRDAAAAKLTVISRTIAPAPTRNRGFDGFQTVTIPAPAGKVVLQGFATLSGGDTGSVVITSTSSRPSRYRVELRFPGENGTPGRLHVRVQLVPKA